ncbi:MAG: Nramp family divalent metal transporter [Bacteroidia bacterium]|nr:Nramp family divalent metal transporter [Bacteroidia bacterium]
MKLSASLKSILPGIFLIGFNIGTGSVTAMAKAGADYGMSLLWALAISCLITFFLIWLYGKFTMVTGDTALFAFRKHIHPALGWFFILALTINVSGGIMGVMGIVAEVLHVWSKTWMEGGISPLAWAALISGSIYALFWVGSYRFFEKALAIMVGLMGLSFMINFILLTPALSEMLSGLIPRMPAVEAGGGSGSSFLVVAGMVGTTVSSMIFIIRTTQIREEGWTLKDSRLQKRDAGISALLMFVISMTIMSAAVGALHSRGLRLEHASDMIGLLEPVAGTAGVAIFVLGLTAAGMSSQFPNILLLPWLLCDYFQIERNMKQPRFRLIVLGMSLLSLVVPLFGARPVLVMIASQALAAIILPATVAAIFWLTNQKKVMGEHTNTWKENLILGGIQVFALLTMFFGLKGLVE